MSNITIVSLLSEQLIPNILFIREFKAAKHVFVTTEFTEKKSGSERLKAACGLNGEHVEILKVTEDSIDDIKTKLSSLALPANEKYLLNITGGTKIMVLGVSKFFEEYYHETYYCPIGKNSYKRIFPKNDEHDTKFTTELSVEEYLGAYGFVIENHGLKRYATSDVAEKCYQKITMKQRPAINDLINLSNENPRSASVSIVGRTAIHKLIHLVGIPLIKADELQSHQIKFLISGWLEAVVYYRLKSALQLPEASILANCTFKNQTTKNEADVIFVRNNQLFVVECKTGFKDFGEGFANAVYKLAALRSNMGLRIPGFIFLLDARLRDASGKINETYAARAKSFDTRLIDKPILDNQNVWNEVISKI